jgi:hypothetical protein
MSSSTERSPFPEANSFSAIQGIPHHLWNMSVYFRARKIPPLVFTLGRNNLVHVFPNYSFNIHYNIILPSTIRNSKQSLSFRFL